MAEATAAASAADERRPLSRATLASYAAPATPLALAGLPMGVYLPVIYADSDGFGLSLAIVGILITASRVTDVVTDPWIGYMSDRIRTRWGRRKPFVLIGTPIYGLALYFLFRPPFEFSDMTLLGFTFNNGYAWLTLMLVFVYLGSTIKDLPYSAWGAELSSNYNERTLIMSWREGFAVAGSLIAAFIPAIILLFGFTKPTDAVNVLVIGMAIFMPILTLNALAVVPEWPVRERSTERIKLMDGLRVVAANRPYVRLCIIFAFGSLGSAMTNSLSFFFVKHVLIAGEFYGLYLAPYFVCQIVAVPLWFKLSRKVGKHRALMWAIGWYAIWSCFIPLIAISPGDWFTAFQIPLIAGFFGNEIQQSATSYFDGVDTGKFLFFILIMCLKGSAIGALSALPRAMCADVIDIDTAQTGKQRAGAYFSIWSMVQKATYALGVTIGLGLVVIWGFDSLADPRDTTNTFFALIMLACTYSIIPAVFKFVGMPLLWNYPLTEERVKEVQAEIAAQKASGDAAPAKA